MIITKGNDCQQYSFLRKHFVESIKIRLTRDYLKLSRFNVHNNTFTLKGILIYIIFFNEVNQE